MKRFVFFASLFWTGILGAQPLLTLEDCQVKARQASALTNQFSINQSVEQLQLLNLSRNNFPRMQVLGQASYQSDVFLLPVEFPGFMPPIIPKDQYQLYLEVNQNLFDGGLTRTSKTSQQKDFEVQNQSVEVDLYRIQEIINGLFFNALLLQENQNLMETLIEELTNQHIIVESRVENGVLLPGAELILMKEILEQQKTLLEVQLQRQSVLEMLGSWIQTDLDPEVQLVLPGNPGHDPELKLNRPEQRLFVLRQEKLEADKKQVGTALIPRFSAFGQAGMGSPNKFNPFDVPLTSFYMIGLRVAWNPWDWGNVNRKKEVLALGQESILTRKTDFERVLSTSLIGDYSEIEKLTQLIEKDEEIIKLQESIVKQAFSQFTNGVISSTDYVTEIHAETRSKLTLQIHQIQLAKARIDVLTHSGNL